MELVIGIAGGSGSGKTTMARLIRDHYGRDNCTVIFQDSYYKDQSEQFDHEGGAVNYDHPDSIEFSLLVEQLIELKSGKGIEVPYYDFATHKRKNETLLTQPKRIILIDGILIFSQKDLKQEMDLKIFIDAPESVRFQRRLSRDVKERGRSEEGVHKQFFSQVKPMHDLFVEPEKFNSDLVLDGECPLQESLRLATSFIDSNLGK